MTTQGEGEHGGRQNGCGVVGRVLLDRRDIDHTTLRLGDTLWAAHRSDDSPEGVKRVSVEGPAVEFAADVAARILPEFHERRSVTSVAVPEPQLVSIVGRYDEDELIDAGRRVAADHDAFPERPDVTFVLPLDVDGEVFARTYEYGVGVSRSSAAGVAAAHAVCSRLGVIGPDRSSSVLVRTPDGPVRATSRVVPRLETNATLTYRAALDPELLGSSGPIALDLHSNIDEVMAYAALRSANARVLEDAGVRYSAL